MALFCLSQHSHAGYTEAASIIEQLEQLRGDVADIKNASAYVAASVKAAHHKLNPGGARYSGMGGYPAGDPRIGSR